MAEKSMVYVVDDDPAVLKSVEALLSQSNYEVVCYSRARDFLAEAALDHAGCVISDVQMPEINGVELLRQLNAANSPFSVVVVTGVADVPTTVTLMQGGALTLLEKPYDQAELLRAVERATIDSLERWRKQQDEQSVHQRLANLSDEEQQVLKLILAGEPNKAIARTLNLSMRTVDRRRQAILEKMQVQSVPELAILLGHARYSTERNINRAP